MRRLALSLVAASCVVILGPAAEAAPEASRVVDRTFVCQTGYLGGVHQIETWAGKGARPNGKRLGFTNVTTNLPEGFLGGITSDEVWVNKRLCRASKARLPLSRAGLSGGSIGISERRVDCFTPRTVLIRVRGDYVRPTTFRTTSPYGYPTLRAVGVVVQAQLAVGSASGRLFAYASVDSKMKTRLYTNRDCKED